MSDEKRRTIHEAIEQTLDDGEIAIAWSVTVDVAGVDGSRHLSHRYGGGSDGTEPPAVWAVLGMLQAAERVAEVQLLESTVDADAEDDAQGE